MIKVDRARKAQTHDRLANHACELRIENVGKHYRRHAIDQIVARS
jgi:hypothetical protein